MSRRVEALADSTTPAAPDITATQAPWEHMRALRPDWPSDDERRRDLADHIALKRLLDRVAGPFLAAAPR